MGSCTKLIGVNEDTSPSLSARVHSNWPMVPSTPHNASHSQAMPCGGCQTNNAGSNDIGTANIQNLIKAFKDPRVQTFIENDPEVKKLALPGNPA